MMRRPVSLHFAMRELRAGTRGLRIALACLAIGVAAIASVGSLRTAITRGLDTEGRRMLGGDLEIQGGAQELPRALPAMLRARGDATVETVQMRSMVIVPHGGRQLVELKAVDDNYPLVGTLDVTPAMSPADRFAPHDGRPGLLADRLVVDRLGLHPGDVVRLGDAEFSYRGVIESEPDRTADPTVLGPRAMIATSALAATGLIQPGSLVSHAVRVVPGRGDSAAAIADAVRAAFPGTGWRIRLPRDAAQGIVRFLDETGQFMTLVGLTALLVGGLGVGTGVRAWLAARAKSIATLRCLGAPTQVIFASYLFQVAALAAIGIVVGLVVGAVLPVLAITVFGDSLPVPARVGVFPAPLALAATYGVLTAALFAIVPLARAASIPGATLFRDAITPARGAGGRWATVTALALAALLAALAVATSPDRPLALWFCAAAALTLALFRLGGLGLVRLAARLPHPPRAWARLGLGNLYRPGSGTALMLLSVGLGLTTLSAVALIEGNIRRQVSDQMVARAPSFFFIDIQNDQLDRFGAILAGQRGIRSIEHVPTLRARIVSMNGVPVDQVRATPDSQWALRGDRGLTFADRMPANTRLVAGQWWPEGYDGPPLLALDAALARGWGLSIGDTIRVNVLGRDIDLKIAALRDVAWRTLGLNFTFMVSPGLLSQAPHGNIATVKASPEDEAGILRAVTDALPNVTGIRVADILATVAELVGRIGTAVGATGSLALVAGALVLAGTVAAGQRRRTAEAVILKTLGATRWQIRAAWLVEFGLIGLCAGAIAAVIGTAASFGVIHYVMQADWSFLPGVLAATVLGCVALMIALGYLGTEAALRAKAAPLLRND